MHSLWSAVLVNRCIFIKDEETIWQRKGNKRDKGEIPIYEKLEMKHARDNKELSEMYI